MKDILAVNFSEEEFAVIDRITIPVKLKKR